MHLIRWISLGCTLCLPALAAGAEGAYTDAQAARGKQAFGQYCVECHHGSLRGSAHGPALVGSALGEAIERAQDADAQFDLSTALHGFIGDGTIAGIGDTM